MKNVLKGRITGMILTILSLVLTIGVKTFFSACGPKEDGSFMTCHWAEQAVLAMGIALTAMSVILLIMGSSKAGFGAALSILAAAGMTVLIPGVMIDLCMMPQMHCHVAMRPAVIVLCALIIVTAAVHIFMQLRKKGAEK